jgi:hypothetical protein
MNKYEKFYDEYSRRQGVVVHHGCPEDLIIYAEKIINRKFPKSYRTMLSMFGWMQVYSDIVYGLGPDVSDAESVLEVSVFEGVHADPPMLNRLIPIVAVGNGDHFCLDTAKITDGDCCVVVWEHDHPKGIMQRPKKQSGSLIEWLQKLYDRDVH